MVYADWSWSISKEKKMDEKLDLKKKKKKKLSGLMAVGDLWMMMVHGLMPQRADR